MSIRNWKWWSPAAMFGLFAWNGTTPLSSLSDLNEPRIGVLSDALKHPLAFEAIGFSLRNLGHISSLNPNGDAFSQFFAVFERNGSHDAEPSPITGKYVIDGSRVTFIPLNPLRPGLTYRAVLQVPDMATQESLTGIAIYCDVAIPTLPATHQVALESATSGSVASNKGVEIM